MESNDQSELIERYLLNRMNREERADFENLMKVDSSLYEEVQIQKELLELAGDEDFQTIFPHLKALDKAYHESKKSAQINSKKLLRIIIVVFSFILILYFIKQCAKGS